MDIDYFRQISSKIQDDFVEIIQNNTEIDEYQLLVYKYLFKTELGFLLAYGEPSIEINDDNFVLCMIPDYVSFDRLRLLDDVFDKFELTFLPDDRVNILKIEFKLKGE